MNKLVIIFLVFWGWLFLTLPVQKVSAGTGKEVVIVNPIRGSDFQTATFNLLETPENEYKVITQNNLPATWLVRYDALINPSVVAFLKSLNSNQEVGLFLEVTPSWTKDAGVDYNQSAYWHLAGSALLTGYSPDERKKLIDQAVKKYQKIFGANPKSVGAWWIDAGSLDYLHQTYGIQANLDVADQYSTDEYQVWGQYWGAPFYPARNNGLFPALSTDNKIGLVTIQWALRDPFNGYGNGVDESTYSVQVNDYLQHNLDSSYFGKLMAVYPETTFGLENTYSWGKYGSEYQDDINLISNKVRSGIATPATMSGFSAAYQSAYPDLSPNVLISSSNPLGGQYKVVWHMSPKYRVGWFYGPWGSAIRDLRVYDPGAEEPCLKKSCQDLDLSTTFLSAIDDINFNNQWMIDQGSISNVQVSQSADKVLIAYINSAGIKRSIAFLSNDIQVDDKTKTLAAAILDASNPDSSSNPQKISIPGYQAHFWQNLLALIVNLFKFFIFTVIFFLIPGFILTRRFLLSIPVGWSIFTLLSFVLGFMHLRLDLWIIPIASISLLLKERKTILLRPKIHLPRFRVLFLVFLITTGSIFWLLTVFRSGFPTDYGFGYWGPNGHDAIWHLGLISELEREFPPQNPMMGGVLLTNYHYFFDLLLASSSLIFGFDNQDLLFRFFPLMIAPLSGLLIFAVALKLTKRFLAASLAAFFLYFGGSFGWIVSLFRNHSLGGESTFWAQQSISTLLNPPFAISLVLLLTGLLIFIQLSERKNLSIWGALALIITWGTLIEFKVYAGLLALFGFGIVIFVDLLIKRHRSLRIIFGLTLLLSIGVFIPNNLGAQSLLVLSPLWLANSTIDFPDRLGWEKLSMAREAYFARGNWLKFFGVEVISFLIFFTGNLGTRALGLLGLWRFKHSFKEERQTKIFLLSVFLAGLVIPLVFIQKGNNWNIVQFFYYSLVVMDISAAVGLVYALDKLHQIRKLAMLLIVAVLTIPTSLNTVFQYVPSRPPSALPKAEYQALNFLKQQPPGLVLTQPFDEKTKDKYIEPLPLYAYTTTGYVAAFSGHPTFLEDLTNQQILGIDYSGRLNEQSDFFKQKDRDRGILKRNNIKYLYIVKSLGFEEDDGAMGVKKIFENDEVDIFQVL